MEQKNDKKDSVKHISKKRSILLKGLLIISASLILLYLITLLLPFLENKFLKENPLQENENFPITSSGSKLFYPVNYDEDIFTDKDYLSKNRNIRYSYDNFSFYLEDQPEEEYDKKSAFFLEYFKTLINGDYKNYQSFFADSYKDQENPYDFSAYNAEPFTAQKIYDIEITYLDEAEQTLNNQTVTYIFYDVKYKILKNNGTFRQDSDDDGVIPLVFSLVYNHKDDTLLIYNISPYDKLNT